LIGDVVLIGVLVVGVVGVVVLVDERVVGVVVLVVGVVGVVVLVDERVVGDVVFIDVLIDVLVGDGGFVTLLRLTHPNVLFLRLPLGQRLLVCFLFLRGIYLENIKN